MRCDTARKRLSDAWGGRPPRRPSALARHLGGCADCRAYEEDQRRLQALALKRAVPLRPGDGWTGFERRLESALEADATRRAPRPVARRWAWAGAALLLLALAGGRALFLRKAAAGGDLVLSFEEAVARISGAIGDDEELAGAFNETLLAAIDETVAGAGPDLPADLLANPDFLEGLEAAGPGEAGRGRPAKT